MNGVKSKVISDYRQVHGNDCKLPGGKSKTASGNCQQRHDENANKDIGGGSRREYKARSVSD
jgi:hypothetical protein